MVDVARRRATVASHAKRAVTLRDPVADCSKSVKTPATDCRQHNRTRADVIDSIQGVAVTLSKFDAVQRYEQDLSI